MNNKSITFKASIKNELQPMINKLDLHSRIYIGQYDDILRHIGQTYWSFRDDPVICDLFSKIRMVLIPELPNDMHASLGIWSTETPEAAVKAYDLQQCLRYLVSHYLHRNSNTPKYTVNFCPPLIHSSWYMNGEQIKRYDDILKSYEFYPEYKSGNFSFHIWTCPLMITEFNGDTATVEVDGKVADVLKLVNEVDKLIMDCNFTQMFEILYPDVEKNLYSKYTDELSKYLMKERTKGEE